MKEKFNELNAKGHPIYFSVSDNDMFEGFEEEVNHTLLPKWDSDEAPVDSVDPEIVETMKRYDSVVVCGMWLDLCVFQVSKRLAKEGLNVYIYNEETLTLASTILDEDSTPIEELAKRDGLQLKTA